MNPGGSCEPPGPKRGWECATLSFPCAGHWAPGQAAGSPTLFSTASGVSGLAAGPSASLRRAEYRVRPLCPLRAGVAAPAGRTRSRHTGQTTSVSGPVQSGTAAAVGGTLARNDGSSLLPLRLLSVDQPAVRHPDRRSCGRFPTEPGGTSPEHDSFWRADEARLGPAGGAGRRKSHSVLVRGSSRYPLGNRDSAASETNAAYLTRLRAVSHRP